MKLKLQNEPRIGIYADFKYIRLKAAITAIKFIVDSHFIYIFPL